MCGWAVRRNGDGEFVDDAWGEGPVGVVVVGGSPLAGVVGGGDVVDMVDVKASPPFGGIGLE